MACTSQSTMYKVFAKCFLKFENKVLILQKNYDGNSWHLPGGTVEPNETLEDACIREIFEETGLSISTVTYVESKNFFHKEKQFLGALFVADAPSQDIKLSSEHLDFAWITRSQINDYPMVNGSKQELLDFFASL